MASCLYSAGPDIEAVEVRRAAEVVCAVARDTPIASRDHHVRITKVGARFIVKLHGIGAEGPLEREVLLTSLDELPSRAPTLVIEEPPKLVPPPPPSVRIDTYPAVLGLSAPKVGVAGAVGVSVGPRASRFSATLDARLGYTDPFLLRELSAGARVRFGKAHSVFLGAGLGISALDAQVQSTIWGLPAYGEIGADFFRTNEFGIVPVARIEVPLAASPTGAIVEDAQFPPLEFRRPEHAPIWSFGLAVRL